MKLKLDHIEIDNEALHNVKKACRQEIKGRGKKYNCAKGKAIFTILLKDCRNFFVLSCILSIFVYTISIFNLITKYDDLLFFQTASLVLLSLVYLLKDNQIHMQELTHPTLIGSTKIFIYKMSACMIFEILIILLFTINGMINTTYPLYQLLLVGIIPIFLLHGIAIHIAGRWYSLKSVIFILILLYIAYFSGYNILKYQNQLTLLFPYVVGILMISIVYDCFSIWHLQKVLFKEGRYTSWN